MTYESVTLTTYLYGHRSHEREGHPVPPPSSELEMVAVPRSSPSCPVSVGHWAHELTSLEDWGPNHPSSSSPDFQLTRKYVICSEQGNRLSWGEEFGAGGPVTSKEEKSLEFCGESGSQQRKQKCGPCFWSLFTKLVQVLVALWLPVPLQQDMGKQLGCPCVQQTALRPWWGRVLTNVDPLKVTLPGFPEMLSLQTPQMCERA